MEWCITTIKHNDRGDEDPIFINLDHVMQISHKQNTCSANARNPFTLKMRDGSIVHVSRVPASLDPSRAERTQEEEAHAEEVAKFYKQVFYGNPL